MPTIYGDGFALDKTFKLEASLKTTTSQFKCVAMVPGSTTTTDFQVTLCGQTSTAADATAASFHCIGILQTYHSANSSEGTVRMFGISKAICAHSITAGNFIMPYYGISTTSRDGTVVEIINGTSSAYGMTLASHCVVLGRALEKGVTGTVITVFINPQMYDAQLVGSLAMT
jgi:hypothetical protein